MSRVRKQEEYNAKKNRIVMMSIDLLDEIGYEHFSVNKVIANAGMTKGAFFHYFKSKNELIEEIVNIILLPMAAALEEIVSDKTLLPKQKILNMADSVNKIKSTHKRTAQQLVKLLQKEENKNMAHMVTEKTIEMFLPMYEKVLIEGNELGQFNIEYPNGSAFIYFNVLASINKEIGAVMRSDIIDKKRYFKLREKVSAFEAYAQNLFNFDNEIKVIDEKLWNIDLKRLSND
ncbi:MAG: TetR/AcrR family transcriptional regulator [Desulfobacterales bacterium]|nr:TetR/AcrR family transcriptional regulator [Desulfobacterales bacterium]